MSYKNQDEKDKAVREHEAKPRKEGDEKAHEDKAREIRDSKVG